MIKRFDIFLSHNSSSKPAVRELAEALHARGLKVWLDEWELVPGRPWQQALEEIIETARSSAVLVGEDGVGPWQDAEMQACLSEFVDRKLPVIPVLLPGAPEKPRLPLFLKRFTWVDLRNGLTSDGLDRVQWGVTGKKPEPSQAQPSSILARETAVAVYEAHSNSAAVNPAKPEIVTPVVAANEPQDQKRETSWSSVPARSILFTLVAIMSIFIYNLILGSDKSRIRRNPAPVHAARSGTPLAAPSAQRQGPVAGSPSSQVTLQELSSYIYEGNHTSAQINDFVSRNLHNTMVLEGSVGNVSNDVNGSFTVIVRPSAEGAHGLGWLTFESAHKQDMLSLTSGQKIRATGVFNEFDGRFFFFNSCELLDVLPNSK